MGALAARRLPRSGFDLRLALGLTLAGALLAALCVAITVAAPVLLRFAFYLTITGVLVALCLLRPQTGVLATTAFLAVLALVRRLLIVDSSWYSTDPLLLVGPTVLAVLVVQLYVLRRRGLGGDLLSWLILAVLGLSLLQIANPTGVGIAANVTGLLFAAVPLVWFFVGRELATPAFVHRLLQLLLMLGVAIGAYGLAQTQIGFPAWDQQWIDINGYVSLNVGGTIRGFGSFSSSAEYALWLGSALAVAVALVMQGRAIVAPAIPLLAVALFLSSARSALITAALAVIVLVGVRTRRPLTALATVLAGIALAVGSIFALGGVLAGAESGNNLIAHQVGGLANPLDPSSSTLLLHVTLVKEGFLEGVRKPLGSGTGATNGAAGLRDQNSDTNQDAQATELDLSNEFVNLGLLGGLLYAAVVVVALAWTVRGYFRGTEWLLPVLGVLVVGLGQWLTGGHYALSPLTWLLVGAVAADARKRMRAKRAAPAGPV